jgi:hypothetical protein
MIFANTAILLTYSRFRNGTRLLRSSAPGSDLPRIRGATLALCSIIARQNLMGSLRPPPEFAIESLRRTALNNLSSKERIMLDVAFVALGLAALGLMGLYALSLRQL